MKNDHVLEISIALEEGATLPTYASQGAAGADVRAHLESPVTIPPGGVQLISTGLRMAIPEGYEIQIRPRSGLALKEHISVLNTPGTIDSDYRGIIGVIVVNHSKKDFVVEPNMRIAQFVLAPVLQAAFIVQHKDELAVTTRGSGGFGHTGMQ